MSGQVHPSMLPKRVLPTTFSRRASTVAKGSMEPASPEHTVEGIAAILEAYPRLKLAQLRALLWPDLTDAEVHAPRGLRGRPNLNRQLIDRVRRLLIYGELVISDDQSAGPEGFAFSIQPGARPKVLRLTDLPWGSDNACTAPDLATV